MSDINEKLNDIENRLITLETEFRILSRYAKYVIVGIGAFIGIDLSGVSI